MNKNLMVDTAGMRPLSEVELQGYAGIEGPVADARIAVLEIDGIQAELVLCDAQLGLTYSGPNDELHCWAQEGSRFARSLVAVEVVLRSNKGTLGFADLADLGFEHVVGEGRGW